MVGSRRPAHNEDAHEEDHGEEDPHEEAVHDLGHLLPLGPLSARGPLLAEAVGDVLHVAHQFGLHPRDAVAMATEHAGAKGHGGAQEQGREGLLVLGAAGGLLVLGATGGLLLVRAAELAVGVLVAGQGVPLLPGDVVLGLPPGEVLGPWRLGSGVPGVIGLLVTPVAGPGLTARPVGVGVGARAVIVELEVGGGGGGRGGAVLADLVDEADPSQVVQDQAAGPLWDGACLGSTVVDVHDEDGQGRRRGDHRHGGNVILPWMKRLEQIFIRHL